LGLLLTQDSQRHTNVGDYIRRRNHLRLACLEFERFCKQRFAIHQIDFIARLIKLNRKTRYFGIAN
jgi:hypothetical protein